MTEVDSDLAFPPREKDSEKGMIRSRGRGGGVAQKGGKVVQYKDTSPAASLATDDSQYAADPYFCLRDIQFFGVSKERGEGGNSLLLLFPSHCLCPFLFLCSFLPFL